MQNKLNRIIKREELYELVWKMPMIKLAKKYGLSDQGLAKICKRMNIPKPPVGCWAKVQHGQEIEKPKLPQADKKTRVFYEIMDSYHKIDRKSKTPPDLLKVIKYETNQKNKVKIKTRLSSPHFFIRKMMGLVNDSKPNQIGFINFSDFIRVTPDNVKKAFRISDSIIKAAEKRYYITVIVENDQIYFNVFKNKIKIRIFEKINRIKHDPSKDKRKYFSVHRKYDYISSDIFGVEINMSESLGVKKTLKETDDRKIVDLINDFFIGLAKYSLALTQYNKKLEIEDRRREEKLAKMKEAESKKKLEQEKLQHLEDMAEQWEKSKRLRSFIEAVKQKALYQGLNSEQKVRLEKWVNWAV